MGVPPEVFTPEQQRRERALNVADEVVGHRSTVDQLMKVAHWVLTGTYLK